jgi:hypothetical protein
MGRRGEDVRAIDESHRSIDATCLRDADQEITNDILVLARTMLPLRAGADSPVISR